MDDPLTAAFDGLRQIYTDLDADLAALAPVCRMRGVCCEGLGSQHHLYATGLEVALVAAARPPRVTADGPPRCPFHAGGRCHARDVRPLGCRLYFCDPAVEAPLEALSVRYHERLRRLIEATGVDYDYRPFVEALQEAIAPDARSRAGRNPGPGVDPPGTGPDGPGRVDSASPRGYPGC